MIQSSLALAHRFPYMFDGDHMGRVIYRGWIGPFRLACQKIDQILPAGKLGFRWIQLGERDGAGWFVYVLSERRRFVLEVDRDSRRAMTVGTVDVPADLCAQIDGIVLEAELATVSSCMVCGCRSEVSRYFGRALSLCPAHEPQAVNRETEEGLEGVWRQAIAWEDD